MPRRNFDVAIQVYPDGPRPVFDKETKGVRKSLICDRPPSLSTNVLLGDRDVRDVRIADCRCRSRTEQRIIDIQFILLKQACTPYPEDDQSTKKAGYKAHGRR
jgi:hypothetical protein